MIAEIIQMLLVLLLGTNNGPVNDLRKRPTHEDNKRTIRNYLKGYFQRYGWIIFILLVVLGLILFALLCFTFVGAGTESGVYYYGMEEVI